MFPNVQKRMDATSFAIVFTAAALLLCAPVVLAQRTTLKPGWNLFSVQQDIAVGKQNSLQAEKQLPLCNAPKVDEYLTQLGKKLVAHLNTHGAEYPWEFHCVNDRSINAFALPGGYVFVNRGAIEAADNEAQLAGVMAHELSHVALRHGTNQASRAQLTEGGLGIVGGLLGGGGGAMVEQLGTFAAGSVLLRYSRSAETQADVSGTQVLYDAGYDPRAMAQFFEKLEAQSKGKTPPEFFSDHPNPDRRVERVDQEIEKLGGTPLNARKDSQEFEAAKREVMNLPIVKKVAPGAAGNAPGLSKPAAPSARYSTYDAGKYKFRYPDNWKKYGDQSSVAFAPDGGIGNDASGHGALAYGLTLGAAPLQNADALNALDTATQQLIAGLQQSNPNMKVTRQPARVRLNNQPALSTYLSNDSPMGGQETDWIITVVRPEGLVYFVCTAPAGDFHEYNKTFSDILDSVRFQ